MIIYIYTHTHTHTHLLPSTLFLFSLHGSFILFSFFLSLLLLFQPSLRSYRLLYIRVFAFSLFTSFLSITIYLLILFPCDLITAFIHPCTFFYLLINIFLCPFHLPLSHCNLLFLPLFLLLSLLSTFSAYIYPASYTTLSSLPSQCRRREVPPFSLLVPIISLHSVLIYWSNMVLKGNLRKFLPALFLFI